MRHPRNILAIAVVAVALCADRTVAAGTAGQRTQGQETLTGQIVRKLQNSFRRIVPSAIDPFRSVAARPVVNSGVRFVAVESTAAAAPLSPAQFCQPPPAL